MDMPRQHPVTDQLRVIAGHVQLLADLMLAGPDLQDVDRGAFAQVLQDLASRLDQVLAEVECLSRCPHRAGGSRP